MQRNEANVAGVLDEVKRLTALNDGKYLPIPYVESLTGECVKAFNSVPHVSRFIDTCLRESGKLPSAKDVWRAAAQNTTRSHRVACGQCIDGWLYIDHQGHKLTIDALVKLTHAAYTVKRCLCGGMVEPPKTQPKPIAQPEAVKMIAGLANREAS